jgi:STE24 endopeptidase
MKTYGDLMNLTSILAQLFTGLILIQITVKVLLDVLNYIHRKKNAKVIPTELEEVVEKDTLHKMNAYSNAKLRFTLFKYGFNTILFLTVLYSGLLPVYYNFTTSFTGSWYPQALLFYGGLFLAQLVIGIPFDLYFNFHIERKFQFNTMNAGTWISDLGKSTAVSVVLGFVLLSGLLLFLYLLPGVWWILVWILFFAFSLVMQIIYPTIIAPLFNSFKPLENSSLQEKIDQMLLESGFTSGGVYEMDASKRSSHGNAYFTGLGKTKRIVLFDSLLANHDDNEIVAVLAHETGHFKLKHVLKKIVSTALISLILLFFASRLIKLELLYNAFLFDTHEPFIGILLMFILIGPVSYLLTPLGSYLSRRHEYQADRFAHEITGTEKHLVSALKKLTVANLANIYPAPLFSWFYYSHPPLFQRIRALRHLK